jgi:hypothetical protein
MPVAADTEAKPATMQAAVTAAEPATAPAVMAVATAVRQARQRRGPGTEAPQQRHMA